MNSFLAWLTPFLPKADNIFLSLKVYLLSSGLKKHRVHGVHREKRQRSVLL